MEDSIGACTTSLACALTRHRQLSSPITYSRLGLGPALFCAMGNSASSSARQHDDTVDYGFLTPQGVYTGPRDWNQQIVGQLIVERRLAPFYRPLEDYDESWDDEQILAARKELPEQDAATSESGSRVEGAGHTSRSASISSVKARQNSLKEPSRSPEALVYRGAIECPICFLVCLALLIIGLHSLRHASHSCSVLSAKYQPLSLLLPSNLY